MKITYILAALLLMPSFATQATAHVRTSSDRPHLGIRPPISSRPLGYTPEGHEIIAPPWSAACMTDQGPTQCGDHMWSYGGS
jgi:hypothetical protein